MNRRFRDLSWWATPAYVHTWPGQVKSRPTHKHSAARKSRAQARHAR